MFKINYPLRFLFLSSFVFLKQKKIEFTNTIVSLHEESIKVDRTQFIGFDLRNIVPALPQSQICDEVAEAEPVVADVRKKEHDIQILIPVEESSRQTDLKIYEKYRGVLFTSTLGKARIISYFSVQHKTISWNQTAILLLLLTEAELNGQNSITTANYLNILNKAGIPSGNWSSNITRHFKFQDGLSEQEIICSQSTMIDRTGYFDELVTYIDKCIFALDKLLERCADKDYVKTTSNLQILHTIANIAFSGRNDISTDNIYNTLKENNVTGANFTSNLISSTMRPLFSHDKDEKKISICPFGGFLKVLETHKNLLKRYIGKTNRGIEAKNVQTPIMVSEEKNIMTSGLQRVLEGYGAIIRDATRDHKIFIHAPRSIIGNTIDDKRSILLLCLLGLKELGIGEIPYANINWILRDNRMGPLQVPRDMIMKNTLFLHDAERKTFSPNNSEKSRELIRNLTNYRMNHNDITNKITEILPVMKSIIASNPRGYIDKRKFLDECRIKGISLILPRDIPRLFGFFHGDNFYFSILAFEAASKITINNK